MNSAKKTKVFQPLLLQGNQIRDSRRFLPADIEAAKAEGSLCPVCRATGSITLEQGRPLFVHDASHEPETPERQEMRGLLGRWMHSSLRDARVRTLLPWNDTFLDVGAVRHDGARVALRIVTEDPERGELRALRESLRQERTVLLLLLDASRLPPKAFRPGAQVLGVRFRRAESDMLRLGDPLLYFEPRRRGIFLLEPPEEALPLLREPQNLGQCKGVLRHYRFSELHLRQGRWWIDRRFDEDPTLKPDLNKTVLRRLRELAEDLD